MMPGPGGWGPAPVPDRDQSPVAPHPRRWAGLAALVLAQLLVGIQVGAFNVSLPAVQAALHIADLDRSWLVSVYTLAFAALVVLGGQVSDVVGRRPVFGIGLVALAVSSGVAGIAPDTTVLMLARVLQGFSGALVVAAALGLLLANFSDLRERRTALGIYAAVSGGGTALGVLVGGSLDLYLNWRMGEFVVIPLAVVALIGALTSLHDHGAGRGARMDPAAVAFGTGGMIALTFGLNRAQADGWGNLLVLLLVVVGVAFFGAFLWRGALGGGAAVPQSGAEVSRFGAGMALALTAAGLFAVFDPASILMQLVFGFSLLAVGLALAALAAALAVGALVAARLLDRVPARALIVPGLALIALGLALLSFATVSDGFMAGVLPGLLLVGLGAGASLSPLLAVVCAGTAPNRAGAVAATVGAALQAGAAAGVVLFSFPAVLRPAEVTVSTWPAVVVVALGALLAGLTITARPAAPAGAPQDGAPGWAR
jgi:MFS family permease